jgi:chromosome segregation ATPase
MKNAEIADLNAKINSLNSQIARLLDDKNGLEKMVQGLNDVKSSQTCEIAKLIEDNKKLSQICQDQDRQLKLAEQERLKLNQKINENNYDIKNLTAKLQAANDNIAYLQNQLDNSKGNNLKLTTTCKDYENQINHLKADNDGLKNALLNEKACRDESDKRNCQLSNILNDRERELGKLHNDYDTLNSLYVKTTEDKNQFNMENDKLRNHIYILTDQNQKLIAEIENVLDQDLKMKEHLSRKDRITILLRNNKNTLEQSLNNLDNFLNRSGNLRSASPKYTYNREDQ